MNFECCETKNAQDKLKITTEFLKVIAEENRLKILCVLSEQAKADICVCDIWQYLNLSQNLVSHHLKVLRDFGLVESKKVGTSVIYSLNYKNIRKYKKLLNNFI